MTIENRPYAFSGNIPIGESVSIENDVVEAYIDLPITYPRSKTKKAVWFVGTGLGALSLIGGELHWAMSNKGTVANLSREIIGFENTQWIEQKYLAIDDYKTRKLYQFGLGPEEQPFEAPVQIITTPREEYLPAEPVYIPNATMNTTEMVVAESFPLPEAPPKKLRSFVLPDTHILLSNPLPGEGSWSIDGLPTSAETLTMAKTFIRPDAERPYSSVGVIVFDSRRVNLNLVGGATDRRNGGDQGPGRVPSQDLSNLQVVMNGGFQFDHARQNFNTTAPFVWGAYLDGVEYATLQPGMGSVAVFKDGSIKIGVWGEGDLAQRTDDMVSVRQNGKLMVHDGELTPAIKNQGDLFLWGKLTKDDRAGEIITQRSAIGMTKDGNLILAASHGLSALNFARGLQAAGAHTAFQLDINSGWVQLGVVTDHKNDGTPILSEFMSGVGNGNKFLSPQARDLMYITRSDDSRYQPE